MGGNLGFRKMMKMHPFYLCNSDVVFSELHMGVSILKDDVHVYRVMRNPAFYIAQISRTVTARLISAF